MKRILFAFFGIFLFATGVSLTACGQQAKASISLSSDAFKPVSENEYSLELSLNEGDEHSVVVVGKVSGASDGRIKVPNDYENIVKVTTNYNAVRDENITTITALSEGEAALYFKDWGDHADPIKINVFTYSDILTLDQVTVPQGTKDTQYVEKSVELELDSNRFLTMTSRNGGESNRKDINWTFSTEKEKYDIREGENEITLIEKRGDSLVEVAKIKDNSILIVDDKYADANIELVASSKYTALQTEVSLVVLKPLLTDDIDLAFGRTKTSFVEFDDSTISTIDAQTGERVISIIRNGNDESVVESCFYVKVDVDCAYNFEIGNVVYLDPDKKNKETTSHLSVRRVSQPTKENPDADYVYQVKGVYTSVIKPQTVYLVFNASLKDYDKTESSFVVPVAISDVVDTMRVYNEDGQQVFNNESFEIYDNYQNGKGESFNIQLGPDTVKSGLDTYKIIATASTDGDVEQMISMYYEGSEIVFANIEGTSSYVSYLDFTTNRGFANNSEIYIKAKSELCKEGRSVRVRFESTQTQAVYTEFTFVGEKAPGADFVIEDPEEATKFIATNAISTVNYELGISALENANGLYFDYDETLPISISGLIFEEGKLKFSITNTSLNFKRDITLMLKHRNNRKCLTPIVLKAVIPLEEANIRLDSTNSLGVAKYAYTDGSLSDIIMTIGAVAKLSFVVTGDYEVEFDSSTGALLGTDGHISSTDGAWILSAGSTDAEKVITVTFKGCDANGEAVEIEREINLEVYTPVATVNPDKNLVSLIAKDSLSSEDENLAKAHISIKLRNDGNEVTYRDLKFFKVTSATDTDRTFFLDSNNIHFVADDIDYNIENVILNGNNISFDIVVNSTNGYDIFRDTLNIEYQAYKEIGGVKDFDFGGRVSSTITINAQNATRVQKVTWENEVEEIRFDITATDTRETNFILVNTIEPQDAYNTNLTYIFSPDDGTNADVVTVSQNGIVSMKSNLVKGGKGYIFVMPSDAIKTVGGVKKIVYLEKNEHENYVSNSVNLSEIRNKYDDILANAYLLTRVDGERKYVSYTETFKKIRVVVEDGQSKETAFSIYTVEQLKNINPAIHYVIMTNLTLNNWEGFDEINASIYGYVPENRRDEETKGSRSSVVLTFTGDSNPFTETLNGEIGDLTFVGEVNDAFVAIENNGTIENVTIDIYEKAGEFKSSTITGDLAGSIAVTNNGTVTNSKVLGATVSGNSMAGGVVAENAENATVSNVDFEFYNFADGENLVNPEDSVEETFDAENKVTIDEVLYEYDEENTKLKFGGSEYDLVDGVFTLNGIIYQVFDGKLKITTNSIVGDNAGTIEACNVIPYAAPAEALPIEIKTIEAKSLAVGENAGILMFHEITVSTVTLTDYQKNQLKKLNTISFKELFENENIVVTSSNPEILEVNANSLLVKGTGDASLTIYQRPNFAARAIIDVKIIHTISKFGADIENNKLRLQEKHTASVTYSIKDSIYLGSNRYDLVLQDYVIEVTITPTLTKEVNGKVLTISAAEDTEGDYEVAANISVNGFAEAYNKAIKDQFEDVINLEVFKGARKINISNEEVTIYPSNVTKVDVILDTDSATDFIKLSIDGFESGNPEEAFDNFDYNFGDKIKVNVSKLSAATLPIKYKLTIEVKEEYKSRICEDEVYDLVLNSNSNTATNEGVKIKLTLKSQVINHVDMTNYMLDRVNGTGSEATYVRKNQVSNIMTPGRYSIMAVGIDPTYAYYEYFTVSAISESGKYLSLAKLSKESLLNYKLDGTDSTSEKYSYSLRVTPTAREDQYFFRVYVPVAIKEDVVIPFEVTFFDKSNSPLGAPVVSEISVSYQRPAEIIVNENESSILARGGSADVKVYVAKNQVLDAIVPRTQGGSGISIDYLNGPFEDENGDKYYTATLNASYDAKIDGSTSGLGNFSLVAQVSRVINGITEVQTTSYAMTLVDIALVSTETEIIARSGIKDPFDLGYKYNPESYPNEISYDRLKGIRADFEKDGYYLNEGVDFAINPKYVSGIYEGSPITERLYIVTGGREEKVVFENGRADCGTFELIYDESALSVLSIVGKYSTTEKIRLRLDNFIYTNKASDSCNIVSNYYNVSIENYTDEDLPDVIRSAEEFLALDPNSAAGSGRAAEDYILLQDIELNDYTPFDTSLIRSLDGNGHTIKINSFDLSGSGTLEAALFKNVSNITTLKNLRVNYYLGGDFSVNVSTKGYSTIKVAGFAITNAGIITNCHVMSDRYSTANSTKTSNMHGFNIKYMRNDSPATTGFESTISGFVITNSGTITNSTVGGKSYIRLDEVDFLGGNEETIITAHEVALEKFSIIGQGTISGFVNDNSGVITSSAVDQIEIKNQSLASDLYTTGFANKNTGRISTSYIQGMYENGPEGTQKTYSLSGSSISGMGYVAGFIGKNNGNINDCYSNILIKGLDEQPTSYFGAGFVYENTGKISTSYSGCQLEGANLSQTKFSGVDVKGTSLNKGTIELSYYNGSDVSFDLSNDPESTLDSGAVIASNPESKAEFYGFTFASSINANDGIWVINDRLLTLVAPNQKAFSHRAYQKIDVNDYQLPYARVFVDDQGQDGEYIYGGIKNPIIIRTAEEFNLAMGAAEADTTIGKYCKDGIITGSYRLLSDIALELSQAEGIAQIESSKYVFNGIFEGNGFEIKNISLGEATVEAENYSTGLFSQIYDAAVVNLNLEVISVTATKSGFVGSLAGVVYGSSLININVQQITSSETVNKEFGVQGRHAVGAVAGAVFGDCKIANINVSNPIVQSTYYDEKHDESFYTKTESVFKNSDIRAQIKASKQATSRLSNEGLKELLSNSAKKYLSAASYAGGIFGYFDVYKEGQIDEKSYNGTLNVSDSEYSVYRLRVNDTVNVLGEVTGGLFGYVGINSNIKDSGITLTKKASDGETAMTSNILSYNAVAGGIVGISAGNMKQVFAKHEEQLQIEIEENVKNYYSGNTGAERGLLDVFENTLSFDGAVTSSYNPKYIGGIIGLARGGKLTLSYNKLNVISSINNCIAGGVIGVVVAPEGRGSFTVKNTSNEEVVTTMYLSEVFAFGDVLGGKTGNKYISGGIVGEIKDTAKLTLSAVNSVNYFGVLNENVYNTRNITDKDVSDVGVYAILAKKSDTATIASIMPSTGTINKEKHIGYIHEINSAYNVVPFDGFDETSNTEYFKIKTLSDFGSVESASIDMDAAFIGSANWATENWKRDVSRLFPEIKLIDTADYIYWDQDNTREILSLMNGSTKEIRVRGKYANGMIGPITVSAAEFGEQLGIANYSGRLIGGWKADGSRDVEKAKDQRIIISGANKQLFDNLGAGAIFENVYIEYGGSSSYALNGGVLVGSAINDVTFNNVHIDISGYTAAGSNLKLQTVNGNAGLIAPSAQNTSFNNIYLTIGTNKIEVELADATSTELTFGLLAGSISQNDKYKVLSVDNIKIDYDSGISSDSVDVSVDERFSTTNSIDSVYVGFIAGKISSGDGSSAEIKIGDITFEDNRSVNAYDLPLKLSIGSINSSVTYYAGGYFGYIKRASIINVKTETKTHVKVSTPVSKSVYVGGLFGYVTSNSLSINSQEEIIAKVNNEPAVSTNAYIGGLIGKSETSSLSISTNKEINTEIAYGNIKDADIGGILGYGKGRIELKAGNFKTLVGGSTEDGYSPKYGTITNVANIGGLVGKTEESSQFAVSTSGTADKADPTKPDYNVATTINVKVTNTANVGGIAGNENSSSTSFSFSSLNADLELHETNNTLNAGLIFGNKTNKGTIKNGTHEMDVSGQIVCAGSITTANVGGLVGLSNAELDIQKVKVDVKIGKGTDPIVNENANKGIIKASYESNVFNSLSAESAKVGGYVGNSTNSITVDGGEIKDSTEIAVSATGTCYVGGIVGYTTGKFTLSGGTFKNSAIFAVENTATDASEINVGGLIGEINTSNAINVGNPGSTNNAFVDANFFVSAKTTKLGGMIGKVTNANGFSLQNTIFGGAFKSYGTINEADHVFGGIVGWVESVTGTTKKVENNSSFGDDIITYGSDTRFSSYTFGGIIGHNNGLSLSDNYSLTTCNNDRIATNSANDKRGAIVGTSNSETYNNNLYSHVVNLCVDDKGTDVGYMTPYDAKRGYDRSADSSNDGANEYLVKKIKDLIPSSVTTFDYASKLNPKNLHDSQSEQANSHTNGVSYFYFGTDNDTISNQITAAAADGCKRAIIGNARVLKYSNKTAGTLSLSFVSGTLYQNEIISGMNLNIDINDDNGKTHGGLISEMTGGTIYAVALSGKLSVGGSTAINLAPFTSMNGGYIDECNSSVDVIYRAKGKETVKNESDEDVEVAKGQVAGFVAMYGSINSIDIRNSYSTGQVSTYISASAYSFTDGHASANQEKIRISNCYTISQIDQNDYTTTADPSGTKAIFGTATLANCWYDVNGTQVSQEEVPGKLAKKTTSTVALNYAGNNSITNNGFESSVSGWTQSKDFNFGYATRKFGYLKQSSYVTVGTTYQEDGTTPVQSGYTGITTTEYTRLKWSDKVETGKVNDKAVAFLVPNAGKLAQIKDNVDNSQIVGNYVQWYDFDLQSASTDTSEATVNNGNLTKIQIIKSKTEEVEGQNVTTYFAFAGTYDGQEHTIKGLTNPLFNEISGIVRNLRLTDVNINKTEAINKETYIGSLAQVLTGELNNIVVSGFIDIKNAVAKVLVGGIVGAVSASNAEISNSKNYIKIDAAGGYSGNNNSDLGGISGWNNGTITNCINYAPINNEIKLSGHLCFAGGISGTNNGTIENCGNTNSVIAGYTNTQENTDNIGYSAGGVAGYIGSGSIQNCYNTAMIKAGNKSSTKASYAGGIVGKADGGTFQDLYNSGVVEALGENGVWKATTDDTNKTTVTVSLDTTNGDVKGINVYARGIIGSGQTATNYKNEGQIIRNGVYNTENETYTCAWDSNTKTGNFSGFDITVDNYSAHITGYDDLGYPSSLCVTAERDVKISGTSVYVVQGQQIITKTCTLNSTQSYYENSKLTSVSGNWSDYTDLMNNADKSNNPQKTVTIGGDYYSIVTDKSSFNSAINSTLKTAEIEVNLIKDDSLFKTNYSDLVNAGYSFDLVEDSVTVASKGTMGGSAFGGNIEVLGAELTTPDASGNCQLKVTYTCDAESTVSGITFNYQIQASRGALTATVTVGADNLFEAQNGGNYNYNLYIGNEIIEKEDEEDIIPSEIMEDGKYYDILNGSAVKIATAQYTDATKMLSFTTTTQISNGTTLKYVYGKKDVVVGPTAIAHATTTPDAIKYVKSRTGTSQTEEHIYGKVWESLNDAELYISLCSDAETSGGWHFASTIYVAAEVDSSKINEAIAGLSVGDAATLNQEVAFTATKALNETSTETITVSAVDTGTDEITLTYVDTRTSITYQAVVGSTQIAFESGETIADLSIGDEVTLGEEVTFTATKALDETSTETITVSAVDIDNNKVTLEYVVEGATYKELFPNGYLHVIGTYNNESFDIENFEITLTLTGSTVVDISGETGSEKYLSSVTSSIKKLFKVTDSSTPYSFYVLAFVNGDNNIEFKLFNPVDISGDDDTVASYTNNLNVTVYYKTTWTEPAFDTEIVETDDNTHSKATYTKVSVTPSEIVEGVWDNGVKKKTKTYTPNYNLSKIEANGTITKTAGEELVATFSDGTNTKLLIADTTSTSVTPDFTFTDLSADITLTYKQTLIDRSFSYNLKSLENQGLTNGTTFEIKTTSYDLKGYVLKGVDEKDEATASDVQDNSSGDREIVIYRINQENELIPEKTFKYVFISDNVCVLSDGTNDFELSFASGAQDITIGGKTYRLEKVSSEKTVYNVVYNGSTFETPTEKVADWTDVDGNTVTITPNISNRPLSYTVNVSDLNDNKKIKEITVVMQKTEDKYIKANEGDTGAVDKNLIQAITVTPNENKTVDGNKITFTRTEKGQKFSVNVQFVTFKSTQQGSGTFEFVPTPGAGVILKADINLGEVTSAYNITQKVSGNGYFVNYFTSKHEFIHSLTGNSKNYNFIRDLGLGAVMVTDEYGDLGLNRAYYTSTTKETSSITDKVNVSNLSIYGSLSIKGDPSITVNSTFVFHYNVYQLSGNNKLYYPTATFTDCKNYANYSAFNDQYNAGSGIKFYNVSENYGLIVGFDGKDGAAGANGNSSYYHGYNTQATIVDKTSEHGGYKHLEAASSDGLWKVITNAYRTNYYINDSYLQSNTGSITLDGSTYHYEFTISGNYGTAGSVVSLKLTVTGAGSSKNGSAGTNGADGQSFNLSSVINKGIIKAGNGGNGGRGGDGGIGIDTTTSSSQPTQGAQGGAGGGGGAAGTVSVNTTTGTGVTIGGGPGENRVSGGVGGYSGNTGHGGLWLVKFTGSSIDTSIDSNVTVDHEIVKVESHGCSNTGHWTWGLQRTYGYRKFNLINSFVSSDGSQKKITIEAAVDRYANSYTPTWWDGDKLIIGHSNSSPIDWTKKFDDSVYIYIKPKGVEDGGATNSIGKFEVYFYRLSPLQYSTNAVLGS